MKTLLFIGHSYHRKTASADFLLDLLRAAYEVSVDHVDPGTDPSYALLPAHPGKVYDVVVCWDVLPPFALLTSRVDFRRGVFFPMYNSCPSRRKMEHWYPYRRFQFICFCRLLHRELRARGFSTHYLQYFPEPDADFTPGDGTTAFFWNRHEALNLRTVQELLSGTRIRNIHLHQALDPQQRFVEPPPDSGFHVTRSSWHPDRADMLDAVRKAAVYIAPRAKEGIGMSFLEAMAQGRCVVSPDRPTMNEYIENGTTGILYDPDHVRPLQFPDVAAIQRRTWEFMRAGRRSWREQRNRIPVWIEERPRMDRLRLLFLLGLRLGTRSTLWRRP